jgi:hypothetical protein
MNQDAEHLRLLAIFHYVVGGLMAFFACIPFLHVFLGLAFLLAPQAFDHGHNAPPAFLGLLFVIFGGIFILIGWTMAILVILTGRFLGQRRHYTFCFVMACVMCIWMPLGTILGVFSLIVLNRASVKPLFPV